MANKAKSIVWEFFLQDKEDISKVKCKICGGSVSRGGKSQKEFNTSNMLKHIRRNHNFEYEIKLKTINKERVELQKKRELEGNRLGFSQNKILKVGTSNTQENFEEATGTAGSSTMSQKTIEETFELKKIWDINSIKAKKIHYLIAEMIIVDSQPFSIVEDLGFRRFLTEVLPNYGIPSRKYIYSIVTDNIYNSLRKKVQNVIEKSLFLSFTTDIWSTGETSFISLTAHALSPEFDHNVTTIAAKPFPESHTAENICNIILQSFNEYDIPFSKVHLIARDNGANVVKGIQETGFDALPCFLHTLQLVIHDSVFEQRLVKDLISKCKSIVKHFNHSPHAYKKLRDIQKNNKIIEHKLIQDVPTRWNSTFLMLERLYEQRVAIINFLLDVPKLQSIDANGWLIIGKTCILLEIFQKVTTHMSFRCASASEIIPQIILIEFYLKNMEEKGKFNGIQSTVDAVKKSMKERFKKYFENNNLILATFLDPRYKNSIFINRTDNNNRYESNTIKEKLLCVLKEINSNLDDNEEQNSSSPNTVSSAGETEDYDFSCEEVEKMLEKEKKNKEKESEVIGSDTPVRKEHAYIKDFKKEFDLYLNTYQKPAKNSDPFQWWKSFGGTLPNMSLLARKFLSAPPSSVESERLFSIGGNIYTPKRNRIGPDTGEKLMFLNYNMKIFNFEY